jgi:hypothetical protein
MNKEYIDAAQEYLNFKVKNKIKDLEALQKITNELKPLWELSKKFLSEELILGDHQIFILSVLLIFQKKTDIKIKTRKDVLWDRFWIDLDEKILNGIKFELKIGLGYEIDINNEIFKLITRNLIVSLPQTPEEIEANEFKVKVISQDLFDKYDEKVLFALKEKLHNR